MTTPSGPPVGPPPSARLGQFVAVVAAALAAVEAFGCAAVFTARWAVAAGLFVGCAATAFVVVVVARLVRDGVRS